MSIKDTIRNIMNLRGFTNQSLAAKLGSVNPSMIANRLARGEDMKLKSFLETVEAMDCEVIVRSKLADKTVWKVGK